MKNIQRITAVCVALACTGTMAQTASSAPNTVGDVLGGVTVSGIVDAYAGSRQLSGGTAIDKVDSSGMSTSQLNFSGEKKLANGLKAEFALGLFLRPDDGGQGRFAGDTFFGRNAYVGLGGAFGTVRLGRQGTGNFLNFLRTNSFGDSATFGPAFVQTWVSAIAQGAQFTSAVAPPLLTAGSRALTGALGTTDSAWNNSVVYVSPSLGGTVLQAQWAPSETSGVGARFGASAFYAAGPLNLGLATEQIGSSSLAAVSSVPASGPAAAIITGQNTWHLSGAYAFGFGRVSAGVITTQRDFTAIADDSIRTVHVGVTVPVTGGTVMFQVANSVQSPAIGVELARNTTSLGYSYPITREADAYAVVMNDQLTGQPSGNSIGLGLRYRF
jgi:predicted porin